MDDWESLKEKGNAAFQAGDIDKAIELFTDALELTDDDSEHLVLSNRSAAYVKQQAWTKAVADAEKVVELKPDWPKGHARLALAAFGNQDFIGARRAYGKASELEPENPQYSKAFEMCDARVKAAANNTSDAEIKAEAEKRMPELAAAFADPKNIEILRTHKRTAHFFKDRDFEAQIMAVHKDPSKMKDLMGTQRFTTCIGILMGLNVVPSQVQQTEMRDQLTISSDEEDDDDDIDSEDDEEDDGSTHKASAGEQAQDPISTKKPVNRDTIREQVAAQMGMSVDDMDRNLRQLHKPNDDEAGADTAELEVETSTADDKSTEKGKGELHKLTDGAAVNIEDDPNTITLPDVPSSQEERTALSLKIKEQAAAVYGEKKFSCALKLYSFAHELHPTNMVFKLNLAAVNLAVHDYETCISVGEEAAKIGEEQEADEKLQAKAYARIAKAHSALKQYDAAIKARKHALELHRCPEHLKSLRDTEKEKTTYIEKLMYDPLKAQAAKARGNDQYKKGNYPEAIAEYTEAIKRDPDNKKLCSRVFCNRAACYTKMAELVLAMQDCDKSLDMDPEYLKAFLRKGKILTMTEQWQDAEFCYVQALDLDPHNFEARMGLEKAAKGLTNVRETAEQRAARSMNDPKIREMWEDCRQLLKDMSEDPESRAVQKELEDPQVRWKLSKLKEAGLLG